MDNPITMVREPKKSVPNKLQSSIPQRVAFLTGSKTLHNETVTLCVKGKSFQVKIDSKGNPTIITSLK